MFADVRCPFAHVGLRRVVAARERRELDVPLRIRAWPLELVNGAPLDPGMIAEEVDALREQVAPDLFAGFDAEQWPSSSIPALALTAGAYAIRPEVGERVALALRWALFEEGRNIASPDVLLDIAEAAGVALPQKCEVDRVRDDWDEGRRRRVIGSPHFFVGEQGWFCPVLDIHRIDGRLTITHDRGALDRFLDQAFVDFAPA